MPAEQPHFAVLTPPGRGAIATVAVRGSAALQTVARRFQSAAGKPLSSFGIGRVVFGRFQTAAEAAEDLVIGLIAEGEIEIHCHGGTASVAAICDALVADGCRVMLPRQWAEEQETDLIAAEALLALAEARTERAAAILLDQYRGAMRTELTAIEHTLARGDTATAKSAIDQLVARANLGLHLTQSWKVVIAGRPNAGKSCLMNALLGYQRAIVWPEPGTTRDVLTATTAIDGWPIELIDTAGLRLSDEPIEAEGVARAQRQIATAELVLLVADVTSPWDEECARHTLRPGSLVIHNKCDLASPAADRPPGIEISALTGQGIDQLCLLIAQTLVPNATPPGAAVPFTLGQVAALQEALGALANGSTAAAQEQLRAILDYNCSRGSCPS